MAAYIKVIGGDEICFNVATGNILDKNIASRVSEIQADGHELELINRHYPQFVSKARVQRFFGDIAKMIYYNALTEKS